MSDQQTMSWADYNKSEPAILADVCAILNGKANIRKQLRLGPPW